MAKSKVKKRESLLTKANNAVIKIPAGKKDVTPTRALVPPDKGGVREILVRPKKTPQTAASLIETPVDPTPTPEQAPIPANQGLPATTLTEQIEQQGPPVSDLATIKAELDMAGKKTKEKRRSRQGRRSTVLTGPQGVLDEVKPKRRTLLGA